MIVTLHTQGLKTLAQVHAFVSGNEALSFTLTDRIAAYDWMTDTLKRFHKARSSRKYFGRGKGVVAYTPLCNHVPLNGYLIGAHDYEAHHVFDIWYRNTSDIMPMAITGDMHSVNKVNFAILSWFGSRFEPRFTNLKTS